MAQQGKVTTLEPGLVARVAAGFRYALGGHVPNEWMSPMSPLAPVVPEEQRPSVEGRQFDFPVGFNTNIRPRAYESVGFDTLRALADNFDILRLVIETRKDQVCEFPWQVMPRIKNGVRPKPGPDCELAEQFLRKPDQEHSWRDWLRMLAEDLFVLDAPTIYVRPTVGGDIYSFEPIDGATIKRVIDTTGRTPVDGPAYQQVLKGVPAIEYSREELIYKPRNPRTHKVYGFGPVEQIINTVNVALRRQQFTLDYFTSGSVPDALAGVPDTWTTEQIGIFQRYWDALLAGEDGHMAQRRKLRFVPGEIARNFKETKAPPLKDMFDEWLARITCYCFSIDVTPFVAQVNRSVAETNREQSLMEGLGPTLSWAKDVADEMLLRKGWGHLELQWQEGKIVDPVKRQTVLCGYVTAKVMHPDEVRTKELGLDPLTAEQKADLAPPAPVLPGADDDEPPGKKTPPKKEGAYLGKALRLSKGTARAQSKLAVRIEKFLSKQASKMGAQLAGFLDLAEKVTPNKPRAADAVARLDWEEWGDLVEDVEPLVAQVAVSAGTAALEQVGGLSDAAEATMRDKAESWAHHRAAEMVGMRWDGDELLPSTDAKWQITETTREALRDLTEKALDEGWSAQKLAKAVEEDASFSKARAKMIARTELAKADSQGALQGYKASGIVQGKSWQTSEDDLVSEECLANADVGTIPLDQAFPSGDEAPPAHPNCRCVVLPVLND